MTADWRRPVNQLLYSLTYAREVDDEMIKFNGDSAVKHLTLELGPEVYYTAIKKALVSGEVLDELPLLPQFDQAQLMTFLRGVLERLDELRPWQEPEFRSLDLTAWEEHSGDAVQIARLTASVHQVTRVLKKGFSPIGDAQPGLHACILQLRSGETVALLGYYGLDQGVILMADASYDPAVIIDNFISATGFPAEKVVGVGNYE